MRSTLAVLCARFAVMVFMFTRMPRRSPRFSADAYNPNDLTVRLRSQYQLSGGTYLFGEWNAVNDRQRRAFYTGIRQEF